MKTTNKFRNAFLIASFCLLNTLSYAQTKEETISWLKEKLGSYMKTEDNTKAKLVSINECEIVFSFWRLYFGPYTEKIPTNVDSIDADSRFRYLSDVVYSGNTNKKGSYDGYSSRTLLKLDKREENIHERVLKALKHLATFCPKKKEKF